MTDQPKNPQALPFENKHSQVRVENGLTLRDYFAGQVLAGLITSGQRSFDTVCRGSYEMADAMLAERVKK